MLHTVRDVYESQWTRTEHLLASVVDLLSQSLFVLRRIDAANWQDGDKAVKRMKAPEPMPRPGVSRHRRRRGTTLGELAALGARPTYVKGGDDG